MDVYKMKDRKQMSLSLICIMILRKKSTCVKIKILDKLLRGDERESLSLSNS